MQRARPLPSLTKSLVRLKLQAATRQRWPDPLTSLVLMHLASEIGQSHGLGFGGTPFCADATPGAANLYQSVAVLVFGSIGKYNYRATQPFQPFIDCRKWIWCSFLF